MIQGTILAKAECSHTGHQAVIEYLLATLGDKGGADTTRQVLSTLHHMPM